MAAPSHTRSVAEIRSAVAAGTLSAETVVRETLARIDRLDGDLNAFLTVDPEGALAAARAVDARRARGEALGALAGVPIGLKDQIVTRGLRSTCASQMLTDYVPPYDAHVAERLRLADAIIVGKLNQDEFAMGSTGEYSAFGPTRNPWDRTRVPGGSSSGAAAAVAAGLCAAALGTDTGGSIREPAAFCGVVGLKPTYGRVSRRGIVAFASSLDQCGPIARSAEDCALLLGAIAGRDDRDATSVPIPVPAYVDALAGTLRGLRLGVPETLSDEGIDPEVAAAFRAALEVFVDAGATLVPVSLPLARNAVAAYALLANAEASSNLARYDGVRYGHRSAAVDGEDEGLDALYECSRSEGFGPEVKRRILLGTFALSAGYYDAYYARAQRARTLIRDEARRVLAEVDLLAGPSTPMPAVPLGSHLDDPLQMYLLDLFTAPANLTGLPALSIPCGHSAAGLPIGLQLTGPAFEEGRLLAAAHAYQARSDWHLRRPPFGADEEA